MASSTLISLKTNNGVVFEVEPSLASKSKTVQSIIDESDAEISIIPLPNVTSDQLTKILEFLNLSEAGKVKEFSLEKLDNDELKDLLLAVHFLNIEELYEVLTQAVADRIEKKSVGYVRRYFGIENDFTPEEYAAIREKNAWAFRGDVEPEDDDEFVRKDDESHWEKNAWVVQEDDDEF